MPKIFGLHLFCWGRLLLAIAGLTFMGVAQAAESAPDSAATLRAKYVQLGPKLSSNQFMRPLFLDSAESSSHLNGDIYALIDFPFTAVNEALINPAHWCDVLILHLNTKYCHASTNRSNTSLMISIGKKSYQTLDEAYPVEFIFSVITTTPEYFNVSLFGKTGPLGTRDYRIRLEAKSLPGGQTFLHLTYSYAYDFIGRIAMQTYLATIGSGKVGFTITDQKPNRAPTYIGGVRGVVERNTMRYYLAIDAYLGAMATPAQEQLEKRLQSWFTATERYPRQLHEVDRADYLDMKRREYLRMQKPP